jgi:DUF1009 family protein
MERSLALMCGAGVLPARMASEARRLGWRVIAFTFGDAPRIDEHADRVVPSSITEMSPVLRTLAEERVSAALLSGKFWVGDLLTIEADAVDAAGRELGKRAGGTADARLAEALVATFGSLGVSVLDQRPFVADWLIGGGSWSARQPTAAEWRDVRAGLSAARAIADQRIGQTVVVKRGVVAAVEAVEGTTETIRRGTALAGQGAVIVKIVGREHDYRFDLPAIGPETVDAAARGNAAVLAVAADGVLVLERDVTRARADAAGIALVGIAADGEVAAEDTPSGSVDAHARPSQLAGEQRGDERQES